MLTKFKIQQKPLHIILENVNIQDTFSVKISTTFNTRYNTNSIFQIGVQKIFSETDAKLEHLLKTNEKLYVSEAIQKAFIEVNEEGAEAAAANGNRFFTVH